MLNDARWYLLQCKSQQQTKAEYNLRQQGFVYYSPVHIVKSKSKGKIVTRTEPLFSGYLFIHLAPECNWQALRSTRGVSKVVSFNGTPLPVPSALIENLKQRLSNNTEPKAFFENGEKVVVTDGCFKHIEAIVQGVSPDERIIVLMNILHSEQSINISAAQLAKVS